MGSRQKHFKVYTKHEREKIWVKFEWCVDNDVVIIDDRVCQWSGKCY